MLGEILKKKSTGALPTCVELLFQLKTNELTVVAACLL